MGIWAGHPVILDINYQFFGCGIDLCPYHPPELQIRFSSGIYHTPRDLALGPIVQADNFYGRDTSVLNSLARTYLEISNGHCITTPYLDSPDLWNKKDPVSGINCCNLISTQTCLKLHVSSRSMMTSANGNIFRVTGHLCGEFPSHRWIPHTKASDAELWCFL